MCVYVRYLVWTVECLTKAEGWGLVLPDTAATQTTTHEDRKKARSSHSRGATKMLGNHFRPMPLFHLSTKNMFILCALTEWGHLRSCLCVHVFQSTLACNLDVHVCIEQQVLSLQVSVDDAALVAVLHGWQDLPELSPCFCLTQAPVASQVIWKRRDRCYGMLVRVVHSVFKTKWQNVEAMYVAFAECFILHP